MRSRVDKLVTGDTPGEREWLTERVNILVQMKNLLTYPYVRDRVERGELEILGWHYIIETGEIYNFNDASQVFELVS